MQSPGLGFVLDVIASILAAVLMAKPVKWLQDQPWTRYLLVCVMVSPLFYWAINHKAGIAEGSKQEPNLNIAEPQPQNASNRTALSVQKTDTGATQAVNVSTDEVPVKNIRSDVHLDGDIERTGNQIMAQFRVHLYKQDGWFDTGIPITDELFLKAYKANACSMPDDSRALQITVGKTIVYPPVGPDHGFVHLRSAEGSDGLPAFWLGHFDEAIIPEASLFHPLQARVLPAGEAPEQCDFYIIVFIRKTAHDEFSSVQLREDQELMKLVGR